MSIEPNQADWEMAAKIADQIDGPEYAERARKREYGSYWAKLFARHRTNQVAELVEALENATDAIEGKIDDLDSAICCSGHECGCQGASNRQLLIYNLRALIASHKGEAK